jgi:hypothetical protein
MKMGTDWPVNRAMHSSTMGYSPNSIVPQKRARDMFSEC